MAYPVVAALDDLDRGWHIYTGLDTLLFAVVVLQVWQFLRDDDDNWFTRAGHRLKRWLAARLTGRRPAPASGTL